MVCDFSGTSHILSREVGFDFLEYFLAHFIYEKRLWLKYIIFHLIVSFGSKIYLPHVFRVFHSFLSCISVCRFFNALESFMCGNVMYNLLRTGESVQNFLIDIRKLNTLKVF